MPVEGFEHPHLWRWRSKVRYPWPLTPILDPDWNDCDEWQWRVVEGLQQGKGIACLAANEAVRSQYIAMAQGGWETAEAHAADADRSGSPWLNDHAIALRLPDRKLRKEAYAAFLAEQKVIWEGEKKKRDEEAAAYAEAVKASQAREAKRKQAEAERKAEWEAEAERIIALRIAKRAAQNADWAQIEAGAEKRQAERQAILRKQWQCKRCLRLAEVQMYGLQYQLICRPCGDSALGDHETLVRMIAA